jgi:glycosyltransferase involved in cell wall biosynthesis
MNINNITVLIPSWNEERNINKCLGLLKNFKKIIILDSNSSDRTKYIVSKYKNTEFIKTSIKNYVTKLNFLLSLSKTKWVLILDADYEISKNLIFFLRNKKLRNFISGYTFPIYNVINNKIIRENIYPSKPLLVNKTRIFFKRDGHKEKPIIKGKIFKLHFPILHNDKKSQKRWMDTQIKWARYDAENILKTNFFELKLINQLRLIPFLSIFISLIYFYFYKKIFKYGKEGFVYLLQRLIYEITVNLMVIKLIFYKISNNKNKFKN